MDRNKIIEHKRRLDKHKKTIGDIKEGVTAQEKTVDNGTIKKKTTKKRVIDKKAIKKKQQAIAEKAMENARKEDINIEDDSLEEREETKVTITKEERAERFKRLHTMVQDMMKKRNE